MRIARRALLGTTLATAASAGSARRTGAAGSCRRAALRHGVVGSRCDTPPRAGCGRAYHGRSGGACRGAGSAGRVAGRPGGHDRDRLAVGGAPARHRRGLDVGAVLQCRRRPDRTGQFAGACHSRSGRTRARHRRQSARQELAHSPRLREAALWHRSRRRRKQELRTAAAAGRADEGRTAGCAADLLAVRRQGRGRRRAPHPGRGRCGQRARDRRRRALYRLHLQPALGRAEPGADRWFRRGIAPGARASSRRRTRSGNA